MGGKGLWDHLFSSDILFMCTGEVPCGKGSHGHLF